MLTREQNELLCRVEGDAPMGGIMRRHWLPGCMSEEFAQPGIRYAIVKMWADCNWAQVLEGSIDSAHSSTLHSTNMPAAQDIYGSTATDEAWLRPSNDKAPRLLFEPTPYGFRYAAIRKPI